MYSDLPGAAQLLGAKPKLQPQLELLPVRLPTRGMTASPVWARVQETVGPGQENVPALAFQPLHSQVI